jgi:diguanylate cyclase (GGDEF)-like protein/PAS domain S-box-containing protein
MTLHFSLFGSIFLLAAALSAWVGWKAWTRRHAPGGGLLAMYMTAVFIWTFGAALESIAVPQSLKILLSQFEYIGYVNATPLLVLFGLRYLRHDTWLTRRNIILLWIIPSITLLLVLTNAWHGWIWSGFLPGPPDSNILIFKRGSWYWVNVAYIYILATAINLVFLRAFITSHAIYRAQIGLLVIAGIFPIAASILYLSDYNPLKGLDLPPIGFTIMGIILVFTLTRFRLLELVPVARSILIEHLRDGVLVVDINNRIVDINPAAYQFLGHKHLKIGDTAAHAFVGQPGLFERIIDIQELQEEIALNSDPLLYVDLSITRLYDADGDACGRLITLRDVTERRIAQEALEEKSRELELLAITDSLTHLFNRRHAENALRTEFARCERYQTPLAIGLFDIDDFKSVNDSFGHACGDEVIIRVAEILRHGTRKADIVSRFGGEEFLILFPHTLAAEAFAVMERLRIDLEQEIMPCMQGSISVSGGLTAWFPGDQTSQAMRRVDRLLYRAKDFGKNQVVLDSRLNTSAEISVDVLS